MEMLVCKKFCSFYKPGKKDTKCGSFAFLERNLSHGELSFVAGKFSTDYDLSRDRAIKAMICEKCDFLEEDCDFRQGLDSPPCGGYTLVEHLLKER